jgi:glyoxylate carboligase
MRKIGGIDHVLARHVEGASHIAEGYTRAKAGSIGVCIGTSGPLGTDMITGLYSASADSYKPRATRAQIETALAMVNNAERALIVAGGGIIKG